MTINRVNTLIKLPKSILVFAFANFHMLPSHTLTLLILSYHGDADELSSSFSVTPRRQREAPICVLLRNVLFPRKLLISVVVVQDTIIFLFFVRE